MGLFFCQTKSPAKRDFWRWRGQTSLPANELAWTLAFAVSIRPAPIMYYLGFLTSVTPYFSIPAIWSGVKDNLPSK